jgi:hypothetical protein
VMQAPKAMWATQIMARSSSFDGPACSQEFTMRSMPKCGVLEGRSETPTLAIVDSQSVKSAEKAGQRLIRLDMTRARKSRARSAIRRSIRSAY